uniref:Uncharacterized protein n=1 Tax=Oryza sativa subsp. japonica TaxID=39947 RepID=Q338G8_ORYSJ|nr:hypothetical protein LOC_Os10g26440 [Oryza sativa Japonica Group]
MVRPVVHGQSDWWWYCGQTRVDLDGQTGYDDNFMRLAFCSFVQDCRPIWLV